jgi:hypothetical protein
MGLLYKSDLSTAGEVNSNKTAFALDGNAEKELNAFVARYPKVSGFVFDIPQGVTKPEAEILSGLIKGAVSSIGIGVNLRAMEGEGKRERGLMRTLVLIPAFMDKELVSHRLRANFQIKNSRTFSMTDGDDLKTIIKNY